MIWAPEPKPEFMLTRRRFRIRRTAFGYAVYDHATGERVREFRNMSDAVYFKKCKMKIVRRLRECEKEMT